MLIVATDLSTYTLAAGEPFLLDIQFQDEDGVPTPLTDRHFVLSFHDGSRDTVETIAGEVTTDATGAFVRFARDGRFSESLYGQPLIAELAERYRHGRDVIATGALTIAASADTVASLDTGRTGAVVTRIGVRAAGDGGEQVFTRRLMPFTGTAVTPAPRVNLSALSLSRTSLLAGIPVSITITGRTAGAILTALLPTGLALDTATGTISGTVAAAGTVDITLTETLPTAGNSPRVTTVTLTITAPATLGALNLSNPLVTGARSTGTIIGATTGSDITTMLPGLTVDSAARTYAFDGGPAAGANGALIETLANALGSPRATNVAVIAAVTNAVLPSHTGGPTNAGTLASLSYRATGSAAHMIGARFRRATNTADFLFRMTDAANGIVFRIIDDDHYRLLRLVDGKTIDVGGYAFRDFIPALVARPATSFLELRAHADGSAGFYQDGVLVSDLFSPSLLDTLQAARGTGVRFDVTVGPAMADVTWGPLAVPLTITAAIFSRSTRVIDLTIDYAGTPDSYQFALDGGAWADALTLSVAQAGRATVRLPALSSGYSGSVTVALRQKNLPAITATRVVML